MHICLFSKPGITGKLPGWGGVQTHAKNLVALLVEGGYDVSVITGAGDRVTDEKLTIIPVSDSPMTGRPDRVWFQRARDAFLELHGRRPVYCAFSEGGSVQGLMNLMAGLGIPVVVFTHLFSMHYFHNNWQEVDGLRALKSYIFRTLPRILYDMIKWDILFLRKCRKVITCSSFIAEQVEKYYRIPRRKIIPLQNWVDTATFRFDEKARRDVRKRLSIGGDKTVFLMVGNLRRAKGFRVALESFNRLFDNNRDMFLVLSGDGPDRAYIENYIQENRRIHENVRLMGACSHAEMPRILSAGDIFIIPSLMIEGFPYTILEAMSCRLPVLASDIAANREALGNLGRIVPGNNVEALAEAMGSFASDLPAHRERGVLYRDRIIEKFSTDAAMKKMHALMDDVMGDEASQ